MPILSDSVPGPSGYVAAFADALQAGASDLSDLSHPGLFGTRPGQPLENTQESGGELLLQMCHLLGTVFQLQATGGTQCGIASQVPDREQNTIADGARLLPLRQGGEHLAGIAGKWDFCLIFRIVCYVLMLHFPDITHVILLLFTK